MTSVEERLGRQREQRWNQAWALAPYGLLLLAGAVSVVVDEVGWAHHLATLAIAAGLAVWHWWFVLAHPHWCERTSWKMVGYYAGVLAFTLALLLRSDAFQLFIPACYLLAFVALAGWPAYLGVLAASLPSLVVTGFDVTAILINLGVVTLLVALIGAMVRTVEREAIRRRETNSELVAMVAENARLHELLVRRATRGNLAGAAAWP